MTRWSIPIALLVVMTAGCGGAERRSAARRALVDVNTEIERASRDVTGRHRPSDVDAECRDQGSAIEPSEEWAFDDPQSVEQDRTNVMGRLKAMGWTLHVQPEAPDDTILVRRLNGIGANIVVFVRGSPRYLALSGGVDYRFC